MADPHATGSRAAKYRTAAEAMADDQAALFAVMQAVHNHHRWHKGPFGPYVLVSDLDDAYHAALAEREIGRRDA